MILRVRNPSDRSKAFSVSPIPHLRKISQLPAEGYREMGLPVVALHCKVDLTKEDGSGVDPQEALVEVKKYDTGLIQVSSGDPSKMVQSINYILMAIVRQRGMFLVPCKTEIQEVIRFKSSGREQKPRFPNYYKKR
jgi:hypothetical protein